MRRAAVFSTNQVVIGSNAKEFSEVTKGNGSISLKAEVTVVVGRSQVAAFTENTKERSSEVKISDTIDWAYTAFTPLPTWGKRSFQLLQNLA